MTMTTPHRAKPGQDRASSSRLASTRTMPTSPVTDESTPSAGADGPNRSRLGLVLLWSAALTCPCHFPIIVLLLLSGTALGLFFRDHLVLLFAVSAAYFSVALVVGMWRLGQRHARCDLCTDLDRWKNA